MNRLVSKMNKFICKKTFVCFITIFYNFYYYSQQDPKINQLLQEKRKAGSGIFVNDKYKIQIYSGEQSKAKTELENFKKNYKNFDATLNFQQPNYKVWVGSFKSKIEAEKALVNFKKKYPNCILINNNRK